MNDSREATMLKQGILIWLMLAFGCATTWICSSAVVYFLQTEETAPSLRVALAATAATAIVAALVGLPRLYRARRT